MQAHTEKRQSGQRPCRGLLLPAFCVFCVLCSVEGQAGGRDIGWLNIGAVVSASGCFASEWEGAGRGMRIAQDLLNAGGSGRGQQFADATGQTYFYKINVTLIDDGSDSRRHEASIRALVAQARSPLLAPPLYSSSGSALAVDTFRDIHAVISIHPAFATGEGDALGNKSVLNIQCCNPVASTSAIPRSPTTFSMHSSSSRYMRAHIAALARRGAISLLLLVSEADLVTSETCSAVEAMGQEMGMLVERLEALQSVLVPQDTPHLWRVADPLTNVTGRLASAPDTAAERSTAALVRQVEILAAYITSMEGANVIICGLGLDASLLANALLHPAPGSNPIDSLFLFPIPHYGALPNMEGINASITEFRLAEMLHREHLYAGSTADSRVAPAETPAGYRAAMFDSPWTPLSRYVTTTSPWHPDLRYNDASLGDSAAFTAAYLQAHGSLPNWQAASAAAAISVLSVAVQRALAPCAVGYPNLHLLLHDATALGCETGAGQGYARWQSEVALGHFETVIGPTSFDSDRVNSAHTPVLLQLQGGYSGKGFTEDTPLDLVVVAPLDQARCKGCGHASVVSGQTYLPYPLPRSLVHPMPGTSRILMASMAGSSLVVMCALLTLLMAAAGAYIHSQKLKTGIRKSRLAFNLIVLTGCTLGVSWPLTLLGTPTPLLCNLRIILPSLAFTCVLMPVIGKALHASQQYQSIENIKLWKFRGRHALYWLLCGLLVDVVLWCAWLASGGCDAFKSVCFFPQEGSKAIFSYGILVYKGVQGLTAAVAVFRMRFTSLPQGESFQLACAAYHTCGFLAACAITMVVLDTGKWMQNAELIAAQNPAYARVVRSTQIGYTAGLVSFDDAQVALLLAQASFSFWYSTVTAAILVAPKVIQALQERNATAEATRDRRLAKQSNMAQLHARLAEADPAAAKGSAPGTKAVAANPLQLVAWYVPRVLACQCCRTMGSTSLPVVNAQPDKNGVDAAHTGTEAGTGAVADHTASQSGAATASSSMNATDSSSPTDKVGVSPMFAPAAVLSPANSTASMARLRKAEQGWEQERGENATLRHQVAVLRSQLELLKSELVQRAVLASQAPVPVVDSDGRSAHASTNLSATLIRASAIHSRGAGKDVDCVGKAPNDNPGMHSGAGEDTAQLSPSPASGTFASQAHSQTGIMGPVATPVADDVRHSFWALKSSHFSPLRDAAVATHNNTRIAGLQPEREERLLHQMDSSALPGHPSSPGDDRLREDLVCMDFARSAASTPGLGDTRATGRRSGAMMGAGQRTEAGTGVPLLSTISGLEALQLGSGFGGTGGSIRAFETATGRPASSKLEKRSSALRAMLDAAGAAALRNPYSPEMQGMVAGAETALAAARSRIMDEYHGIATGSGTGSMLHTASTTVPRAKGKASYTPISPMMLAANRAYHEVSVALDKRRQRGAAIFPHSDANPTDLSTSVDGAAVHAEPT